MKNVSFLIPKISLCLIAVFLLGSCIKKDNFIQGDAKIRFFNTILADTSDFSLNDIINTRAVSYGTNSSYAIVAINSLDLGEMYKITATKTRSTTPGISIDQKLEIGKNYSVFYTKNIAGDSSILFYEDNLTPVPTKAKLLFINLGYTLGSKVIVRDSLSSFPETSYGYGEKSDYIEVDPTKTRIYFKLTDSVRQDSTLGKELVAGKVYTILIDGSVTGKLQKRLVPN